MALIFFFFNWQLTGYGVGIDGEKRVGPDEPFRTAGERGGSLLSFYRWKTSQVSKVNYFWTGGNMDGTWSETASGRDGGIEQGRKK